MNICTKRNQCVSSTQFETNNYETIILVNLGDDKKSTTYNPGVGKLRPASTFFFEWNVARERKFFGPQACKCGPLRKNIFQLSLIDYFCFKPLYNILKQINDFTALALKRIKDRLAFHQVFFSQFHNYFHLTTKIIF